MLWRPEPVVCHTLSAHLIGLAARSNERPLCRQPHKVLLVAVPRKTASALPCRAANVAPSCASRSSIGDAGGTKICCASCHALLLLLSLPERARGVDVPQPKGAVGGGTDDFVLIQEPSMQNETQPSAMKWRQKVSNVEG